MKTFILFLSAFFVMQQSFAQVVANGNFNSGTASWGCSPETNPQSTYGGPGSNTVAEVDIEAGLCQTITGFTIGSVYTLTFQCSRRTTCGPTVQSMNVNINNGALNTNVSRNGTTWNLANESFTFTATSTSHLLKLTGTTAGTCGLIVDNISITVISNLTTSFIDFNHSSIDDRTFNFSWLTATEENNDYFILDESMDGINWEVFQTIKSLGNSNSIQEYSFIHTFDKQSKYARLSVMDNDGNLEILKIILLNDQSSFSELKYWPNPVENYLNIAVTNIELNDIRLFDLLGNEYSVSSNTYIISKDQIALNLSNLLSGTYILSYQSKRFTILKK